MVSYCSYNFYVFPYEWGLVFLVGRLYISSHFTTNFKIIISPWNCLWKVINALLSKTKDLILLKSSEHHLGKIWHQQPPPSGDASLPAITICCAGSPWGASQPSPRNPKEEQAYLNVKSLVPFSYYNTLKMSSLCKDFPMSILRLCET